MTPKFLPFPMSRSLLIYVDTQSSLDICLASSLLLGLEMNRGGFFPGWSLRRVRRSRNRCGSCLWHWNSPLKGKARRLKYEEKHSIDTIMRLMTRCRKWCGQPPAFKVAIAILRAGWWQLIHGHCKNSGRRHRTWMSMISTLTRHRP